MVYDCFIFFNELDLLEIRLNELNDVVDKFVLVEADRTFQNTPKPYIFEENKERFSKFLEKIIHIKLTKYPLFIPIINPFSPWKIEFFQRDSILKGLVNCKPDDVILISDVDEIPDSEILKRQILRGVHKIYGLKMDMFMYFLNNKLVFDAGSNMTKKESKAGIWHCTALLPYRLLKKKPYRIRKIIMRTKRRGEVYEIIPNAGWHFTYIGGVDKIIHKLEAFSHTEFNSEEYKDEKNILKLIKNGKDLFGRDLEFEIVNDDYIFPKYLISQEGKDKFKEFFFSK
jgi:beta-1,4-mannosyl-glycoprotein beta-1,4-N-acetylglucosaminyltransferase